jgi:hypothetical protein
MTLLWWLGLLYVMVAVGFILLHTFGFIADKERKWREYPLGLLAAALWLPALLILYLLEKRGSMPAGNRRQQPARVGTIICLVLAIWLLGALVVVFPAILSTALLGERVAFLLSVAGISVLLAFCIKLYAYWLG